jgi:Flp pilus assembly protein TadG
VELALVLPFVAVFAVGIAEFALGFLLKQRLTNAAREGVRVAIQMPMTDLDDDTPETIDSVRDAIVEYLANAGVDTSTFDDDPTSTAAAEFTYYDAGSNPVIVIDRGVTIPDPPVVGSPVISATRVTVQYPYSWSFSQVIQLLVPSADYSSSFLISSQAEMKNLM